MSAENEAKDAETSNTAVIQENKDPELDIRSEQFNPLRALNTPNLKVSKKTPKVQYQNLAALESTYKKHGILNLNKDIKKLNNKESCSSNQPIGKVEAIERRFLPHQMPVKASSGRYSRFFHEQRKLSNIFTQMENKVGPMAPLTQCVQASPEHKVRVIVRNERNVRGHIEGHLVCYDKHWNLLLADVKEVWHRRKYNYGENKICGEITDCSQRLWDLGITLPQQQVKSLNRKNVEITRRIPQLLVRGEQVVLVVTNLKN